MSNSDYEDREMEYLIERGTEGERDEKPDSTEDKQEDDPEANELQGNKIKVYPTNVWAKWIEQRKKKRRTPSNISEQKKQETKT